MFREVSMGSAPTLTVGVPVFNMGSYLEAAVESVLSQSFDDLEVLISDNASTDETESVGRALAARDPRVTYRRNAENVGLSANNNLLVPLARGRLFKWAPADDQLLPGYLERCVAAVDADPGVVLAYPRTRFVDGDGNPLALHDPGYHLVSDDPAERLLYAILANQFANAGLGVIRTEALRRTRLLPRYAGGDFRLLAELSVQGKFVEIPDELYVRRIHKGSSGGNVGNTRWLRTYWSGSRPVMRAPYWRLCRDHAGIVLRAPIPWRKKPRLLGRLGWEMAYRWRALVRELVEAFRR
jgi:glycosyltransferase involved in cell wall biosynthesis